MWLVEVGLTATALLVCSLAVLLVYYREELTERFDRGPAVDVVEHHEEGLSDREVQEFNVLHREYKQMQKEKREEEKRKARQQSNAGGKSLNTQ